MLNTLYLHSGGLLTFVGTVLIFVSALYTALYIHSLVCSGQKQSLFGERGESASLGKILTGRRFLWE